MSIDDTAVLARLRAGADTVEEHQFDAHEVLVESRRALRRRRSWQAVGACTTAAVVTLSLAVAGPVALPGGGELALPGGAQLRELVGLTKSTARAVPSDPGSRASAVPAAPTVTVPEDAIFRSYD